MAKSEQVRVLSELMKDIRFIAVAFDESAPELVERVLRAAVRQEMPKAVKIMSKRAEQVKQGGNGKEEAE